MYDPACRESDEDSEDVDNASSYDDHEFHIALIGRAFDQ